MTNLDANSFHPEEVSYEMRSIGRRQTCPRMFRCFSLFGNAPLPPSSLPFLGTLPHSHHSCNWKHQNVRFALPVLPNVELFFATAFEMLHHLNQCSGPLLFSTGTATCPLQPRVLPAGTPPFQLLLLTIRGHGKPRPQGVGASGPTQHCTARNRHKNLCRLLTESDKLDHQQCVIGVLWIMTDGRWTVDSPAQQFV